MLAAMLNDDTIQRSVFVLVIESDNLARMQKADPITLESVFHGGAMPIPRYPMNFNILIAYESDTRPILEMARNPGNGDALLAYLERNRVFIKGKDGTENTVRIPHDKEHHEN
jgi:hypothetical protein